MFGHLLDGDIFDTNSIIAADKKAGFLVQKIAALIRHFLMQDSDTFSLLLAIFTVLSSSTQDLCALANFSRLCAENQDKQHPVRPKPRKAPS